jgi:hypothetical protein
MGIISIAQIEPPYFEGISLIVFRVDLSDLTKYHHGGSIPGINTCSLVFDYLGIPPGIPLHLVSWVNQKTITYQQALNILIHWPDYSHLINIFQFSMLQVLNSSLKKEGSSS